MGEKMSLRDSLLKFYEVALKKDPGDVERCLSLYSHLVSMGAPIYGVAMVRHGDEEIYRSMSEILREVSGLHSPDPEKIIEMIMDEPIPNLLYLEYVQIKGSSLSRRIAQHRGDTV